MAASPIAVYPAAARRVPVAGEAIFAIYGPVLGGIIVNPASVADQGITPVEVLYVDPTGAPAALAETATTFALQPGQAWFVPVGQGPNVSVNAKTAGHRFSGIVLQPPTPFPPAPQTGAFPPAGPTTLTEIIPAYLYQEYNDDEDLQAFVRSYNELAQVYAAWFATGLLPVYTSPTVAGALLDWVALGLYGMARPALGSGRSRDLGPLNTYTYNSLPLNTRRRIGPTNVVATSDDVFKRILTWNFYKGDGNVFNVRWLKRRIMRFLIGEDGTAPNVDETYPISVTFGPGIISIRINPGSRSVLGGAMPNRFGTNFLVPLNSLRTVYHPPALPPFALQSVLKQAIDAGVLQFPFQYTVSIVVGGG